MKTSEAKVLKGGTPVRHKKQTMHFRGLTPEGKAKISVTRTGKISAEVNPAAISIESASDA